MYLRYSPFFGKPTIWGRGPFGARNGLGFDFCDSLPATVRSANEYATETVLSDQSSSGLALPDQPSTDRIPTMSPPKSFGIFGVHLASKSSAPLLRDPGISAQTSSS